MRDHADNFDASKGDRFPSKVRAQEVPASRAWGEFASLVRDGGRFFGSRRAEPRDRVVVGRASGITLLVISLYAV